MQTLLTTAILNVETIHVENHDPDDPIAMYILEASKVEPLTKMEETKLFREMGHRGNWDEQGEKAARRLIESQLMLVVNLAQNTQRLMFPCWK